MIFDALYESAQRGELLRDKCGVYVIRNISNGMLYLGGTARSFASRWKEHRTDLRANRHGNAYLQNAWNKYGESNFEFLVLECVEERNAIADREQYWIDLCEFDHLYNIAPKAFSASGRVVSVETRKKLAETTRASFRDDAMRKAHSDGLHKAYSSASGKRLASEKAKKQWQSPETRRKASESAKRAAQSPELRQLRSQNARRVNESRKPAILDAKDLGQEKELKMFEQLYGSAKKNELLCVEGGMVRFHLCNNGQLTIYEIIVLPEMQRQGIGTKLLERLKQVSGATSIFACCPSDLESNEFYRNRGFVLNGTKEAKSGRIINVWRLELCQS